MSVQISEAGSCDAPMSSLRRALTLPNAITCAAIAVYLGVALRFFSYTEDDAFIPMRYGLNFLHGHGWVMNPGERVEGCTSPIQMWLVTLLLGTLSPDHVLVSLKFAGILCGAAILIMSRRLTELLLPDSRWLPGLAPLILAAQPDFAVTMIDGLETPLAALALCAAVMRSTIEIKNGDNHKLSAALFSAAALCRPEMAPAFPLIWILRIRDRGAGVAGLRTRATEIAIYSLPLIGLEIFRICYYGAVLPNTYYAKSVPILEGLRNGFDYVNAYFSLGHNLLSDLVELVGVGILLRTARAASVPVVVVMILQVLFVLRCGGDWMIDGRFYQEAAVAYVPALLAAAWSLWTAILTGMQGRSFLAALTRRTAAYCCGVVLVCTLLSIGIGDAREFEAFAAGKHMISVFRVLRNRDMSMAWRTTNYDGLSAMSRWITENVRPGQTVLISEIGITGLRNLDVNFIDSFGLTDGVISHFSGYHRATGGVYCDYQWMKPGPLDVYLRKRRPEYIVLSWSHSDPNAPSTTSSTDLYRPLCAFPMTADYGKFTVGVWRRRDIGIPNSGDSPRG